MSKKRPFDSKENIQAERDLLLREAYKKSRAPFIDFLAAIPHDAFDLQGSWRYYVEVNSECNLRCSLCFRGNQDGYAHGKGTMRMPLYKKILDKICKENPNAELHLYGNSEPLLNRRIAEYVGLAKERGLYCCISSNMNRIGNLEGVLRNGLDLLIVSVSGFSQEIYSRAHRRGDIEEVKRNIALLKGLRDSTGSQCTIIIHYHLYNDNWGEEYERMRDYVRGLGLTFDMSWARSISLEQTVQYMRQLREKQGRPYPRPPVSPAALADDGAWWDDFPDVQQEFLRNIDRLGTRPEEIIDLYHDIPVPQVCPVGDLYTFIRFDGRVQLCGCCYDSRLMIAENFLRTTPEERKRKRRWHSFCRACLDHKIHLYENIANIPRLDAYMHKKFPALPADRIKG